MKCDRCEDVIFDYKKPKKFLWFIGRKDYVNNFSLLYYPKSNTSQEIDLCEKCFKSYMKWMGFDGE